MAATVNLGALEAIIVADIRNFQQGMQKAQNSMAGFEKKTTMSLASVAQKFRTFGYLATTALTVPIIAAGKAAFTAAKDYEFAIQKMVGLAGVAQSTANEWSKAILAMSPEIGKGPKELAEGLYFISSSGQKGAAAMNILQLSAKAAASGLGETKQIADLLTSAMNAYAGTGLTAAAATDILVAAVREGKAEATAFAGSVGQIIPIASELGVSFDQVAGGMAAITLTGSSTSQAATYLKGVFNSLLKATMHGEKALNSMGSSYAELRDILRNKGVIAVMQRVRDLSVQYGEELSSEVFPNIRALSGFLSIAGKNFEYNKGIMDRVRESTGSLNVAYGAISQTIQQRLNQTLAQVQVSLVSLGQVIAMGVLPIMKWFAGVLSGLTNWLTNLSDANKKLVITIGLIAAALGPLSLGFSLFLYTFNGLKVMVLGLATGFKFLSTALTMASLGFGGIAAAIAEAGFAAAATGIGLVVAAVAVLSIVLMKAIKKSKELSEAQKIQQDVAKKYNAQLMEEQTVLKTLSLAIARENVPREVRKNLLDEFNARYGTYLGYMLTEENYATKINEAYSILNKGIIQRINLQSQLAQAEKLGASKAEFLQKQAELEKMRPNISYALYNEKTKEYTTQIKELDAAIKAIVENITKLELAKTPFLSRVASSAIEWMKKNKPDEYAAYIAKRTKEEAEAAAKELEKLIKSMGILDGLNAQMTTAKEKEGKAGSRAEIVKWQKEQLRLQKEIDSYDLEKIMQKEVKAIETLQTAKEDAIKSNVWSAEQESWAIYNIQLKSIDDQIALQKDYEDKVLALTAQREHIISEYALKVKKEAAAKYIAQMQANWAMERMAADRNAELTIKDEEERARQIEANRLAEEEKLLGARTITAFMTKQYDPKLLEDQKAHELAVERNSIAERDRLRFEAHAKANAMETQEGQLKDLERRKWTMGDKQYAQERRDIIISTYDFIKSSAEETSLFLQGLSRIELNRVIADLEEQVKVYKGTDKEKALLAALATARITKATDDQSKIIEDFTSKMTDLVNQLITDVAVGLGESLGNMFADQDFSFKNILKTFGGFVKSMGELFIAYGVAALGFHAALDSVIGAGAAIAAGIALVAVGTMIVNKSDAGVGVTPMADGGILYGPTNVLAGEYAGARNNPEIISPLSKLKSMLQPTTPASERLVAEISGRKLQIILLREEEYQNRGKR